MLENDPEKRAAGSIKSSERENESAGSVEESAGSEKKLADSTCRPRVFREKSSDGTDRSKNRSIRVFAGERNRVPPLDCDGSTRVLVVRVDEIVPERG
jgi:hypothetical protein